MTNADCIRRMNDEQLFEFLSEWELGDIDYSITFCDLCMQSKAEGGKGNELGLDCDGCRKHWLQRDAVDFGGLMYWKRNTTFTADTPQTGIHGLTDCDFCKGENCEDCEGGKDEPQRNMAEDIVKSFGFKAESYRQAKAKTEQTEREGE